MFIKDPDEGKVFIGNATCQNRGGNPSAEIVQIRCDTREASLVKRIWLLNGVQLNSTESTIDVQGPGTYTCIVSNICGHFNASTSILGICCIYIITLKVIISIIIIIK